MSRLLALNVGSGQRPFKSDSGIEWINVDSVSRPGMEPDLVCDGTHLPHKSGTVDYVVLHHVLEHFGCNEGNKLIAEAHRVLKVGGSLFVFVPNMRALAERWLQGQIDTQIFLTNVYGAYMGDEADRHKWGFDNLALYELLHKYAWDRICFYNGRSIPGAAIAQDWWILGSECVKGRTEHALILTMNNLELTKRTVESIRNQNTPTIVHVIDNGSSDGTVQWAEEQAILLESYPTNMGVSYGWNRGLTELFKDPDCHQVLVVNNDTILPPWFIRELSSYNSSFITGVAVDQMEQIKERPARYPLQNNPDFSAYLIRRDCWDKVGPFDERMKLYSSDQDYHIRAHRTGIQLHKACVPYFHERSSTLRLSSPEERLSIEEQANHDRLVLREKWGCSAGGADYEALFSPETFGAGLP